MQAIYNYMNITQLKLRYLKCIEIEALIWIVGLLLVALSDPLSEEHFTLFLPDLLFGIKSLGFNLGHSIAFLFRLEIINSLNAHPLGIPAVAILFHRIYQLIKKSIKNINKIRSTNG